MSINILKDSNVIKYSSETWFVPWLHNVPSYLHSILYYVFFLRLKEHKALFNGQRMEKQESSSQINFSFNILCLKSRYLENNVSVLKNETPVMVSWWQKKIHIWVEILYTLLIFLFILSPNIKLVYWCVILYSRYSTKDKNDWQKLGSQIIPGQHLTCVSTPTLAPSAE